VRRSWPTVIAVGLVVLVAFAGIWSALNNGASSGGGIHTTEFSGNGFAFEYPVGWRVISRQVHDGMHGPVLMAAVGTGDFRFECVTDPGPECSGAEWMVPSNRVVLAYWIDEQCCPLPPDPSPSLGAGEQLVIVAGRTAVVSRSTRVLRWNFPGTKEVIEARWGPDYSSADDVERSVSSWQWTSR
jgi:hypothetical protein